MFRNDQTFNQYNATDDVYAGVTHPFFNDAVNSQQTTTAQQNGATIADTNAQTDAGEFNLASIQERLGNFNTTDERGIAGQDVMPSTSTLNMTYQRDYSPEAQTRTKVSTKTKAIAISYVAVVLCLVLAVTLTAVSVGGTFGTFANLTEAYDSAITEASNLDKQIEAGNADAEKLFERATQLGYVDAAETNTHFYQRLETRPAQNFSIESNWFDSLCEWLSGVFGG